MKIEPFNEKDWEKFQEEVKELNKKRDMLGVIILVGIIEIKRFMDNEECIICK